MNKTDIVMKDIFIKIKLLSLAGLTLLSCSDNLNNSAAGNNHRLVVLTDMEADPDDSQSLVRLLLYSNEIDIEGLVATTSVNQVARVAPETIHKIIDAYGKVQPNLLLHAPGYPSAEKLHSVVRQGPALLGMEGVGEGFDTDGSELIIEMLEKDDPRPLWVTVWGGPNVLAQALWKIRQSKSEPEAEILYQKLRVYTISDQDDSGPWIRENFPGIFYIVSPRSVGSSTWGAIGRNTPGANNEIISATWLAENIQEGHGPLGAQYPDVAYSMEGDTPSYLGLILNGLNDSEHPNYGGWGGRYELYIPEMITASQSTTVAAPTVAPVVTTVSRRWPPVLPSTAGVKPSVPATPETRPIWTNADDEFSPWRMYRSAPAGTDTTVYKNNLVTLWRWREDFQNDFAARMDWCTKSFEEANHPPVPVLAIPDTFTIKSGEIFKLDADGTYDPDGNSLSYYWFQYPEAGTYDGIVTFNGPAGNLSPNLYNVHTLVAPEVDKPETIHFILKVTDKGNPPLTRYKRVIITVVPG